MNTNEKMDLLLCERALEIYSAIEAAIKRGSGEYAKEKLRELKSLLENHTRNSAFRSANSRLPRASTKTYEWKPELSDSRSYVEEYARKLRSLVEPTQTPGKVS